MPDFIGQPDRSVDFDPRVWQRPDPTGETESLDPANLAPLATPAPIPEPCPPFDPGAPTATDQPTGTDQPESAPKPKNRTLITGLAAVVALIVVSGAGYLGGAGRNTENYNLDNRRIPSIPSRTPVQLVTLAAPDQIGTLTKAADQSVAVSMRQNMSAIGAEKPYATIYTDSTVPNSGIIVWGMSGSTIGINPQVQLEYFFDSSIASRIGATAGPRTAVAPGPTGGTAQCESLIGTGIALTLCAWTGSGAALGFYFNIITLRESAALVHTMLPAIVTRS